MYRPITRRRRTGALVALTSLALVASACGGDDDDAADPTTAPEATSAVTEPAPEATTAATEPAPATSAAGTSPDSAPGTSAAPDTTIDADRCATNEAAGTITYSSSFDFAAAASIIDVVVAEEKGYFDELCLDVELVPGFSTTNYPLVSAGTAQFSSAGSFTEILNFSAAGGEFVALVNYGKAPIEALVTPGDGATALDELGGAVIGVKGDIPPSLVAMLAAHGLELGSGYSEVLLDGFDPISQLAQVDALPVYKSNEPGQLDAAGVAYTLFDPAAEGIPGSFGLLYTSADFAAANPTVVEDFIRAALKGMEDAIADPAGAVELSLARIDAAGNQAFLTQEGETFRWEQELQAVIASTPEGEPIGLIEPAIFRAEYDAYVEAGVWPDGAPDFVEAYDPAPAAAAYADDGTVIWP